MYMHGMGRCQGAGAGGEAHTAGGAEPLSDYGIRTMDLKIAAIALVNDALLVSAMCATIPWCQSCAARTGRGPEISVQSARLSCGNDYRLRSSRLVISN